MSTTRKQIGAPVGYAKVDPESFSNPGQQTGNCGEYGVHDGGPTSSQSTITSSNADGTVKDSAPPRQGNPSPSGVWHGVRVGSNSAVENRGK